MLMAKSVTYNIHRMEQLTLTVMSLVVMAKEATQSTEKCCSPACEGKTKLYQANSESSILH